MSHIVSLAESSFEFQIHQLSTEVSFLLISTHIVVRCNSHIQVYNKVVHFLRMYQSKQIFNLLYFGVLTIAIPLFVCIIGRGIV